MNRLELSIARPQTSQRLTSEQTAGEKCPCAITDGLQFRGIRMSTHATNHKRDFGSTGRQTVVSRQCGNVGVAG